MSTNGPQERWGRETRLLVLVVVVSLAVLLALARFRFPAANLTVATPPPGPLAGLAGRTAFDDLGSSLNTLLTRVSPKLAAVRVEPIPKALPARGAAVAVAGVSAAQILPALRVRPDLALVYIPPGTTPATMASGAVLEVVGSDSARSLALVRVPVVADPNLDPITSAFDGFSYVGEVSATASGLSVRPEFLGRLGPVSDVGWPSPILAVASTPDLNVGTFLFTMDGHLVGLVVRGTSGLAIVPAEGLVSLADTLARAGAGPS